MFKTIIPTLAGIILVIAGVTLENYGHTHNVPGGLADTIIAVGTALSAIGRSLWTPNNPVK